MVRRTRSAAPFGAALPTQSQILHPLIWHSREVVAEAILNMFRLPHGTSIQSDTFLARGRPDLSIQINREPTGEGIFDKLWNWRKHIGWRFGLADPKPTAGGPSRLMD